MKSLSRMRSGLKQVQRGSSVKATVPEFFIELSICEAPVEGRMMIINQLWGWFHHGIVRWAIECWDGDPFLVAIHHRPMEYTLVTIIVVK
ncbi:hypothetical protein ACFX12_032839 [Malus domestica]